MPATAAHPWPSARESGERAARDRAKMEMLVEENRQLRDKIAALTGLNDLDAARLAFGITDDEATILMLITHCGQANYSQLIDAVYGDGPVPEAPEWAIRSHIKRMRRKLRPHGIDFAVVYGMGYVMVDATRQKVRTAIAGVAG